MTLKPHSTPMANRDCGILTVPSLSPRNLMRRETQLVFWVQILFRSPAMVSVALVTLLVKVLPKGQFASVTLCPN